MSEDKKSVFAKADTGGQILLDGATINVQGAPLFDEFAQAKNGGLVSANKIDIRKTDTISNQKWYNHPVLNWVFVVARLLRSIF